VAPGVACKFPARPAGALRSHVTPTYTARPHAHTRLDSPHSRLHTPAHRQPPTHADRHEPPTPESPPATTRGPPLATLGNWHDFITKYASPTRTPRTRALPSRLTLSRVTNTRNAAHMPERSRAARRASAPHTPFPPTSLATRPTAALHSRVRRTHRPGHAQRIIASRVARTRLTRPAVHHSPSSHATQAVAASAYA